MLKVHILTQCAHCQGQAYMPAGEAENHKGEKYTRYLPCPSCKGSGKEPNGLIQPALINVGFRLFRGNIIKAQPFIHRCGNLASCD